MSQMIVLSFLICFFSALFAGSLRGGDLYIAGVARVVCPPSFTARNGNGEGERKWVYEFTTPDLISGFTLSGFRYISDELLKNDTRKSYLIKTLQASYPGADLLVQESEISVTSVSGEWLIIQKISLPAPNANGAAIKELIAWCKKDDAGATKDIQTVSSSWVPESYDD